MGISGSTEASRSCAACAESVEVDSSHPRVPLDLSDQRCERILTLLQTREDVWKVAKECQYSSFLFDCNKNNRSERPIALWLGSSFCCGVEQLVLCDLGCSFQVVAGGERAAWQSLRDMESTDRKGVSQVKSGHVGA